MKTIVLANQKGGVGKTTLTAHLAVAAQRAGDGACVLIDTDPQASLAAWWNGRQAETPVFAPVALKELTGKLEALKQAGYAYVFIDTPVSYTHLDVYKRQLPGLPLPALPRGGRSSSPARRPGPAFSFKQGRLF